jgi:hypothetical protein
MRRVVRLFAVVSALALGLSALSASAGAASTYTLKVSGIARNGQAVTVAAVAVDSTGFNYLQYGHVAHVPRGTYLVAADVETFSSPGVVASDTLVARSVAVTRNTTVQLDARKGRLLRVALSAAGAQQQGQEEMICLTYPSNVGSAVGAYGPPGTMYADPIASRHVDFVYLSTWAGPGGASYDLSGGSARGIPGNPSYSFRASSLAHDWITARAGESLSQDGNLFITPAVPSGCENTIGDDTDNSFPFSLNEFKSPGRWNAELSFPEGFWDQPARSYAAGHTYGDTFGAAVRGPKTQFPEIQGSRIDFFPMDLFDEPSGAGVECCPKATITLRLGSKIIKKATVNEWRQDRDFQATLHTRGWYTMNVSAVRWSALVPVPAGVLSNAENFTWRFYVQPKPSNGNWQAFPVTLTRFWPGGLNPGNQAAPGSTTHLTFSVDRAPNRDVPTPKYRFKAIAVQASFDGGKTWHPLKVTSAGRYWQASVQNPPAAGYVALRSTVVDVKGDSTVQTIYRAYGIS